MRLHQVSLVLLLAFISACSESPTDSSGRHTALRGPVGVVTAPTDGGTPTQCDPWTDPDWCQTSPGAGECMADVGSDPTLAATFDCPGHGGGGNEGIIGGGTTGTGTEPGAGDSYSPATDADNDFSATTCPLTLSGKVITAAIQVAGILHTFKFTGPLARVSGARSPATYSVHPTVSEDSWWIAESGTIQVNCSGFYSPQAFGFRLWIGTATFAGESDLHMIPGPNHPSSY